MTKHLILGQGNLGIDLAHQLNGHQLPSWRFPKDGMEAVLAERADYVWCAVGGGSVDWATQNPMVALDALLTLPIALMDLLPAKTKLILFSSDYAASEEHPSDPNRGTTGFKSLYAQFKRTMEVRATIVRPENTRVIRICSLYGKHRPEKNLATKILWSYANNNCSPISLPTNFITPTSTEWLSMYLRANLTKLFRSKDVMHHCAPHGNLTIADFGRKVLGKHHYVSEREPDSRRPRTSALGCSFGKGPSLQEVFEICPI